TLAPYVLPRLLARSWPVLLLHLPSPRRASSVAKGVYNPKAVIPHAASLRQAFAHCARFLTAASRRSLGRVSVPASPVTLSGRLPVIALVSRYLTNKLIGREPHPGRNSRLRDGTLFIQADAHPDGYPVLAPVSRSYPSARGRLLTCYSPVRRSAPSPEEGASLDLHVLGTPPAFVLSQDQTLRRELKSRLESAWASHVSTRCWVLKVRRTPRGGVPLGSALHGRPCVPR